jgi:hypothetical protein
MPNANQSACPCEGSMILMFNGFRKKAEQVRKGEQFMGIDDQPCPVLEEPRIAKRKSVRIASLSHAHKCSAEHTLMLQRGGYEFAGQAEGVNVLTDNQSETVDSVQDIGEQVVIVFLIGGNHSYNADGFWALA